MPTDSFQRGLAPSIWVAICGRLVAGFGAAGMTDLVSVIVNGKLPYSHSMKDILRLGIKTWLHRERLQ